MSGALIVPLFFAFYTVDGMAAVQAAELIPAGMELPAPLGLLKILLIVTFFIHIVLMNVLLGSSMLASVNAWSRRPVKGYSLKGDTGFATGVLALTVNFGVAPYLFMQLAYGGFLYSGSLLMAVWWLSIPILVMLAYYALYIIKTSAPGEDAVLRLVISANTLLLMLVAFFLSSSSRLAVAPESWRGWLEHPGGSMLFLSDPTLVPRYLHVLAASLAVGGLFMAARARWSLRNPATDADAAEARVQYGLKCFIYASLAQALSGLWYLLTLPAPARVLFLGQSLPLTAAVIMVIVGLGAAIWAARSGMLAVTCAFTLGLIFIMICVRDMVRDALLAPYSGQMAALPLPLREGQWGGFAIFLLSAAVGVVALIWLLRVAVRTFNGAAGAGGE